MAGVKTSLILPAAGMGTRMGYHVPKPFIPLSGQPAVYHALNAFAGLSWITEVIIPTREDMIAKIREECNTIDWESDVDIQVIEGGRERVDSVAIALEYLNKDVEIVAVHDAVRPLIQTADIANCIQKAEETGAAVLAVPCRDTLKKSKPAGSEFLISDTLDRSGVWQAQTPQCFFTDLILQAYNSRNNADKKATDDAELVEQIHPVSLVEGSGYNIKLTYPEDVVVAEYILNNRSG